MLKHPTSNKGKNQSAENNTTAYQPPPRPQTAVNNNHQSFDLYQDEVWDEDELIEEEEEEEEDEDDEDEGMFSFAPPPENSIQQQQPTVINPNQSSSLQTPPSIYQPNHLNHHHQNSYNLSQQQQQHQQHSHDHPRNHPHDHQPQSPPPPAPPPGWSPSFSPKPPYRSPSLHSSSPNYLSNNPQSRSSPPATNSTSPSSTPTIPATSYPPPQPSTITPAAAIIAQYHRHPETRHRKPNLSTPPNTNHLTNPALQQHGLLPSSRAFSSAISNSSNANNNSKNKNKNSTPNSIEDTPVIELRTGFNAATWRAANHDSDDHESVKSGSSHSLHKLDYYHHSAHSVQSDNQSHKDSAGFLNRFISRSNVDPQSTNDPNNLGPSGHGSNLSMTELKQKKLHGHVGIHSAGSQEFKSRINSGKIDTITGSLAAGIEAGPGLDIKNYSDSQSHLTHGIDGYNMDDFDMDEEDSPYPEVRASVSNIDDPEMPCLTFRAWLLGLFFVIICGSLNMFFQLRYPSPFITPVIVQIISYPAGKLCAAILPDTIYRLPGGKGHKRNGFKGFLDRIWPSWLGAGAEWSLNSGPFNIKEHTVIAIMANAAVGPVYAVNTTLVMEKFYKRPPGAGFDFCIALATQLLGFSLAGVTRRFLIWPASMIWPSNLVICTLLNTFHAEDDDGSDGSLTRFKFFMYVSFGAFVWYWFPGYLFTALSTFSWVCWLAPRNRLVNQLFGTTNGLGLSILTFDWSQIAYIGSPLVAPWWAEVNVAVGFVIFFYILGPILYYTNTWSQAYLPLGGTSVYDRFGKPYNTTRVVDLNTGALNLTAYQEYSPLFLPATFTAVYSIAFALATSAIVHTVLYHGHSIWDKIKNIKTEDEDVHAKLMRNYPEVPDWWYWSYFLLFSGFSIIFIEVYDTGLPIWGLLLALFVALAYVLPGGFIFAMTSQQISINLVAEIIPGYLLPGKPFSNMLFKTFSVQSLLVGLAFIQDLKLGHYMKIPPRVTFIVQIVAAILSAVVQIGVKKFLVATVPDMCDKHQANLLTCPNTSVFYSASVLWGLLGPQRQFGEGTTYRPIVYFTFVGAILPIPFYLMTKRWPNSWLKYVNLPVLLLGACWIPPATPINYSSYILVGFIFQYVLRRTKFRWWSKYNFVLSAGLDVGTVIGAIVIFFVLQLPRKGGSQGIDWWGNNVFMNTDDFDGTPLYDPPAEGFGPLEW